VKGKRVDTRRHRADGKVLGGHSGCTSDGDWISDAGRCHRRDRVPGAFGRQTKQARKGNGVGAAPKPPPAELPFSPYVAPEPGRLNQALQRMVRYGFADEAMTIVRAVRNLQPLDEPETEHSRELLLQALHRRGPFAPERDFRTPRGFVRPAVC
jgi:hypothetical protein